MHIPVLQEKALEYLNLQPNRNVIDCTVGGGGHTVPILQRTAPRGKVLGIDWDKEALEHLKAQSTIRRLANQNRLVLREGNFAEVQEIAQQEKFKPVHGILFDLGFSSDQIESSGRGFSFLRDEPLDMRYSTENPDTAEKILQYSSKAELERIWKEYGEEQFAKSIAEAIVQTRAQKPLRTTFQLVDVVKQATPRWYQRRKTHAATKTFQALRIAVNSELENIRRGLRGAEELLWQGGSIAVISFHSLEDRAVKEFFMGTPSLHILTKKPILPSQAEIQKNPRARSAKLRAAAKQ